MKKLLTLLVPTYNMEEYLDRCLGSLDVCCSLQEWIEVLVIIDGATDRSASIAQKYEKDNPSVFRTIMKENGNYGSCINYGLRVATGVFCKVLDADDWLDSDVLCRYLADLESLAKGESVPDVIQTPFTSIGKGDIKEVVRYNTMGREPYEYGKIYKVDDVLKEGYIRFFLIHGLTYRTEMLRQMGYEQTEGISYTDTEWTCYPFYFANTIVFLNHNLYQYDAARAGQTMSKEVLMRNLDELVEVVDRMLEQYDRYIGDNTISDVRKAWMKQYHTNRIRLIYKFYLLDMERSDFVESYMETIDRHFVDVCKRYGFDVTLYPENRLLRVDYVNYWRRHHHRWPLWMEQLNRMLDVVARWVYVRLIRK